MPFGKKAHVSGEYAEEIDLGVQWSTGAPLPHLVSNASTAIILCLGTEDMEDFDGTNPRSVTTTNPGQTPILELTFHGCSSIRLGSPSDESLGNHRLYGKGLNFYAAHRIHNSRWKEELRGNADRRARANHNRTDTSTHYFLAFHDESFEAIADSVTVRTLSGNFVQLYADAAQRIITSR